MKLTANIKLNPTPEQHAVLKRTLEVSNQACNAISKIAWDKKQFGQFNSLEPTHSTWFNSILYLQ